MKDNFTASSPSYTSCNISVILPVYNREFLIVRALKSLLQQTYRDFEVVCIDDGSTDNTLSILYDWQTKFSTCNIIAAKHQGAVAALNTGLINAKSNLYITFLDSDDEYQADHLEKRFNYMQSHPEIDLLHSNADLIGSEEELLVPDKNNPGKLIHLNDCFIGATMFGKKEVFTTINGFREVTFYDSDLFERAKSLFATRKLDLPTYRYHRDVKDSMLTQIKNKIE
jgi:glycosyltransferase involved in cell wall biosynthesis